MTWVRVRRARRHLLPASAHRPPPVGDRAYVTFRSQRIGSTFGDVRSTRVLRGCIRGRTSRPRLLRPPLCKVITPQVCEGVEHTTGAVHYQCTRAHVIVVGGAGEGQSREGRSGRCRWAPGWCRWAPGWCRCGACHGRAARWRPWARGGELPPRWVRGLSGFGVPAGGAVLAAGARNVRSVCLKGLRHSQTASPGRQTYSITLPPTEC